MRFSLKFFTKPKRPKANNACHKPMPRKKTSSLGHLLTSNTEQTFFSASFDPTKKKFHRQNSYNPSRGRNISTSEARARIRLFLEKSHYLYGQHSFFLVQPDFFGVIYDRVGNDFYRSLKKAHALYKKKTKQNETRVGASFFARFFSIHARPHRGKGLRFPIFFSYPPPPTLEKKQPGSRACAQ